MGVAHPFSVSDGGPGRHPQADLRKVVAEEGRGTAKVDQRTLPRLWLRWRGALGPRCAFLLAKDLPSLPNPEKPWKNLTNK